MSFSLKPFIKVVMAMISGSAEKILASYVLNTSKSGFSRSQARMVYFSSVFARELPHSTRLLKLPENYSRAWAHFFSAMNIFPPHSMMTPITRGSSIVDAKFWLSLKTCFIRLYSLSSMHIWISKEKTSSSMLPLPTSKTSVRVKSHADAAASVVRHAVFKSTNICSRGANYWELRYI